MPFLRRRSLRGTDAGTDAGPLPLAALEFESPSAAIIATPVPAGSRLTNLLVFLLVVSCVAAAGLIRIDKLVSAPGKLVADAPNTVMQPFEESIVESIDVKAGDVVHKGQVLARLNPTFATADLTSLKDQVELLSAEVGRMEAQVSGKDYIPDPANPHSELQASIFEQQAGEYQSTLQNYDQKINQLQSEIAGDNSAAAYARQRLGIASNVETMRQKLQDLQVGSKLETLAAKNDRLTIATSLSQAQSDASQAGRELAGQQAARDAYKQHWDGQLSQNLADTRGKLVEAQQNYVKANLRNQLVVLAAPRDAVVLSVDKISVGSVVTSAEPLITLVPMDAPLSVEADISGQDSGYVRPGDEVRIKFDTLPFLQYGSARGVVHNVSADSFTPEDTPKEGGSSLPTRPHTLYYRSQISLAELQLHDTPPGFRLTPGMPVTADVKVGTRSILAYFISRILPVAFDSMHEP